MKKLNLLLIALVLALVAVFGVIVFKQHEYQQSAEYYESLRVGALLLGRVRV